MEIKAICFISCFASNISTHGGGLTRGLTVSSLPVPTVPATLPPGGGRWLVQMGVLEPDRQPLLLFLPASASIADLSLLRVYFHPLPRAARRTCCTSAVLCVDKHSPCLLKTIEKPSNVLVAAWTKPSWRRRLLPLLPLSLPGDFIL